LIQGTKACATTAITRPNESGGDGGHRSAAALREMERRGYFDVGFEMAVDDSGRRTLRKRRGSGGLRHFSLGTIAALLSRGKTEESGAEVGALARRPFRPLRWRLALQLTLAGALVLLITESFAVIPDGAAGVRVSEIWGARPGTLYPGLHLVTPLVDSIVIYDTREQVYSTLAAENLKQKGDVLTVQAREGLNIGLAVSVRYRLEPKRLDSIHTHLPQPVGEQVVAPVVATIYRQLAPNFITREIFATRREELRSKAAELITSRLASDGIVVREVLLRDLQLPADTPRGWKDSC